MRLVQLRIQGLKQKIAEVSSSEGEVILRMIRKMLPLTSALYRPKKDGYDGEHKDRKEAFTKSKQRNVARNSTTRDKLDDLPHSLNRQVGEGTISKTFNCTDDDNNVDSGGVVDEDSEEDESINADILVAELWDILGVTADYGSPSKTHQRQKIYQENAKFNAKKIDRVNESGKRTYDAGKAILTSKYQEIYDQHYKGHSMSAGESLEEVDDSVQSDQLSNDDSLKPTYSDGIALYSQSAADFSNSFFRRSEAQLSEGDDGCLDGYLVPKKNIKKIVVTSPSTTDASLASTVCSQGDGRILSTASISATGLFHSNLNVSLGQTVRGGTLPLQYTEEISKKDQRCVDGLYESAKCDDLIVRLSDYSDDSYEDEPFRDSVVNMNDTSACINRQIEDVGKAISTLQVSNQIIPWQPSTQFFLPNRHHPVILGL